MSNVEVTSLSSKGQVVIPNQIRKELGISNGSKLLVLTDGTNLLLKPIGSPKLETFQKLVRASRAVARKRNLKPGDVTRIIKKIRHENRP